MIRYTDFLAFWLKFFRFRVISPDSDPVWWVELPAEGPYNDSNVFQSCVRPPFGKCTV